MALTPLDLDALPGFRRRFAVTPAAGRVEARVEDDYHCMAVTLIHDGAVILGVEALLHRAPWTTCPGALAVLERTFTGTRLSEAAARGMKQANCTHLHDLAVLAAAHAGDGAAFSYDILTSDPLANGPQAGLVQSEVRLNGVPLHRIEHRDNLLTAPAALAGQSLFKLRPWIESLSGTEQEAARLLQWGTILAHGRTTSMALQSDASRMPPNCYTFQPERAAVAVRVGAVLDFSGGDRELLADRERPSR